MIRVTAVHQESIAEELGLRAGTELISVDGRELEDFLDWEFLTAEERFLLHVRQPDGEEIEFDIERPLHESLGVSLEPARIRRCANRCDFCFVDGLPDGLRDVLYIRDDDYRLSFRYGNFATLTNLKPRDEERIIEYRLSPLYVSVHATDPTVRRYLLRNPTAPEIVPQLRRFAEHGIEFHTQIVMSPGVNDGEVLRQTLRELYEFGPAILGCSVVPVGLTEFSKHHLVREPTAAECRAAIALVEERSAIALAERGSHWAFGADELYIRAGVELPPARDLRHVRSGGERGRRGALAAAADRGACGRDHRVGRPTRRRRDRDRDGAAHADGARAPRPCHRRDVRSAPGGELPVRGVGDDGGPASGRGGAGGAPRTA